MEAIRKERILWGVLAGAGLLFGILIGVLIGLNKGRDAATEESWSKHCKPFGEFYLCDDLRGFDYEAVDIQFAAMGLMMTAVEEGLKGRGSVESGVLLVVRRDTKESFLVSYYKPDGKTILIVGSVSVAKIVEEARAWQELKCPNDSERCNWQMIYAVSVYEEVVEWADIVVAKVQEKKE